MEAILYIGHGTRSKKGAEEAKSFMKRVMMRVNVPIQEISFLELTAPSIEEGFRRCVESGATTISIVPIFLLAAGHIKEDIPHAISNLQEMYPKVNVTIRDPFGVQEDILNAVAELVKNMAGGVGPTDSLLLVGRGSSDPGIQTSFNTIIEGLNKRLNKTDVSVCYLAAAEPRFNEGLEVILNRTEGRVIVVPYLLFSGLLLNEIDQKVRRLQIQGRQIFHTGPLTQHEVFEWCLTPGALMH